MSNSVSAWVYESRPTSIITRRSPTAEPEASPNKKTEKEVKHNHHILPKNAPYLEELHEFRLQDDWQVSLTIEGHACQHDILYRVFGWEGDKIARDGLSGQIGKEEVISRVVALGGAVGGRSCVESESGIHTPGYKQSDKHRESSSRGGKKAGCITGPSNSVRLNSHPNTKENQKIQGKSTAEKGVGIHAMTSEQKSNAGQVGGRIGGERTAQKTRRRVLITNLETGETWEFPSNTAAGESLGLRGGCLSLVAHKKRPHHKGYKSEFIED